MVSKGQRERKVTKELLVPSDRPVVRYREYLKEWEANGWRIDLKKVKELQGDVAVTIPSPQRREDKGWILDTIPTVGS